MRKVLLSSILLAAALTLAGCLELTDVITLNPDGSGKVQIDQIMPPPTMNMGGPNAPKPDPEQLAKSAVGSMLGGMKNIDAWSDVSYETLKDGKIHLKATGYFADLAKFNVMPGGGGGDEQGLKWSKNDKGGMTLEFNLEKKTDTPPAPAALTDDQVKEKMQQERTSYQQSKGLMTMILGTLKLDFNFRLPGKVDEVNNFKKTDQGVQLVIEGKKVMDAMDKFMADDKALEAHLRSGKSSNDQPENINEMIFGSKGKVLARVSGEMKPLFDYKVEMEKAKTGQDDMLKKLGVEIKAPAMQFGPAGGPPPGP